MIKGIFFDFDGVLCDSYAAHLEAYKKVMAEFNLDFPDSYYNQVFGRSKRYIVPSYLAKNNITLPEKEIDRICMKKESLVKIKNLLLLPGIKRLLSRLSKKGFKIGLASCAEKKMITKYLKSENILDKFDIIMGASEVENHKPAPDVYKKAAKLLQLSPEECVAVEDSPSGIKSAQSAGFRVIISLTGITSQKEIEKIRASDSLVCKNLAQQKEIFQYIQRLNE